MFIVCQKLRPVIQNPLVLGHPPGGLTRYALGSKAARFTRTRLKATRVAFGGFNVSERGKLNNWFVMDVT